MKRIGLDIGRTRVRAVAVRLVGRDAEIEACAEVPRVAEDGEEIPLDRCLAELDARLRLDRPVTVADASGQVMVRMIATPPMDPARLQRLLRLELAGAGSDPADDLAAEAIPIAVPGDELHHAGVIAQADAARTLLAGLRGAGVRSVRIGHAPVALASICAACPPLGDEDRRHVLVVDIGAKATEAVLVGPDGYCCSRQVGIGGDQFTEALMQSRGLTQARAEQAKVDGKFAPLPVQPKSAVAALPADDPFATALDDGAGLTLDDGLDRPEDFQEPGATTVSVGRLALGPELTRVAEGLYGQLAATMAWFRTQLHQPKIELGAVLLCGGGAGLVALDDYLGRRFGVPARTWDPFHGMTGNLPERERWSWAGALGLAIDQHPAATRLDLRPGRVLMAEAWRARLVWPFVAAAGFAVAGAVMTGWVLHQQDQDRLLAETGARIVADQKRLEQELAAVAGERLALTEDLRALSSRIWSGRDLLCTIAAMKTLSEKHQELWVTRLETVGLAQDEGKPTPAADRRGSRKEPRKDSAIERGAVDLSGLVKFENEKTETELDEFRKAWQKAIREYQLPNGNNLFKDAKVLQYKSDYHEGVGDGPKQGRFSFTIRFFFEDTKIALEPAEGAR